MASINISPLLNFLGEEVSNVLNNISQPPVPQRNNQTKNNINYYKNVTINNIFLCLEIPGFLKEDCSINLNGGFLIFEGKTNYQNKGNNSNFDENDFNFVENKNVKTKIDLSEYNIDDSKRKACYINGLLKIKLKKKPKTNITID